MWQSIGVFHHLAPPARMPLLQMIQLSSRDMPWLGWVPSAENHPWKPERTVTCLKSHSNS